MTIKEEAVDFLYKISTGENRMDDFSAVLTLSDKKTDKISLNVYKISIQADLSSAIILGDLYIRPKRDGDSVFYGGCTHKLKKLYNDKKIPPSKRNLIPVLCDDKGVVWVPGFGVRDDGGKAEDNKPLYAVLGLTDLGNSRSRMYLPSEFSKQNK
jgi:tRNA(Ile)-lysidine synthase